LVYRRLKPRYAFRIPNLICSLILLFLRTSNPVQSHL